MIPQRLFLEPASGIASSYKKKYKQEYWDVEVFNTNNTKGNYITPDFFKALKKLDELVRLNKGQFHVTDLFRSWETQATARRDYETNKKKAFVAKPGGSFHNSGRAVDIAIQMLNFEGLDKEHWLEFLWDLAKPLGFYPIIKIPDMKASEAWHFDFPGKDWEDAYSKISYSEVAKCCILDVGVWNPLEQEEKIRKMFIQSQLIRLGYYEIGKVDGIFGSKTNKVLEFLELKDVDTKTSSILVSRRAPERL